MPRIYALFLALSLIMPSPGYALRATGLEESEISRQELSTALHSGLEEAGATSSRREWLKTTAWGILGAVVGAGLTGGTRAVTDWFWPVEHGQIKSTLRQPLFFGSAWLPSSSQRFQAIQGKVTENRAGYDWYSTGSEFIIPAGSGPTVFYVPFYASQELESMRVALGDTYFDAPVQTDRFDQIRINTKEFPFTRDRPRKFPEDFNQNIQAFRIVAVSEPPLERGVGEISGPERYPIPPEIPGEEVAPWKESHSRDWYLPLVKGQGEPVRKVSGLRFEVTPHDAHQPARLTVLGIYAERSAAYEQLQTEPAAVMAQGLPAYSAYAKHLAYLDNPTGRQSALVAGAIVGAVTMFFSRRLWGIRLGPRSRAAEEPFGDDPPGDPAHAGLEEGIRERVAHAERTLDELAIAITQHRLRNREPHRTTPKQRQRESALREQIDLRRRAIATLLKLWSEADPDVDAEREEDLFTSLNYEIGWAISFVGKHLPEYKQEEVRRPRRAHRRRPKEDAAGIEEAPGLQTLTPDEFSARFPGVQPLDRADHIFLHPVSGEMGMDIFTETSLMGRLQEVLDRDKGSLPEGMRVTLRPVPDTLESLQQEAGGIGAIFWHWLTGRRYEQQLFPEVLLDNAGEMPNLASIVLFAQRGPGAVLEEVIGVMTVRDVEGKVYHAFFA